MIKKYAKQIACASLFLILIVYIILLKTVDVQAIGPNNTEIGFASINAFFKDLCPYNPSIDKITDLIMAFSLVLVGIEGLTGLIQWIKRKNLLKVNKEILSAGIVYILISLTYLLFQAINFNYRPVIIDGELLLSFPSSHILLIYVVFNISIFLLDSYYENKKLRIAFSIFFALGIITIITLRMMTGVHWFTDVLGSVIFSLFFVTLYFVLYDLLKKIIK